MNYTYKRLFNPDANPHRIPVRKSTGPSAWKPVADRRGELYLFTEDLILAINVALTTGRPLLLTGPPGSGKSTVAKHIAFRLNWRYLEEVVTHQTRGQDLLFQLDLLERLYDANRAGSNGPGASPSEWKRYVHPGVFWRALNLSSAREYDQDPETVPSDADDPASWPQPGRSVLLRSGEQRPEPHREDTPAVVLIDEIDKADPEVPNSLLHVMGRLEFSVPPLRTQVKAAPDLHPLLILTSNGERSLPDAFLRRCITFELKTPERDELVRLVELSFQDPTLQPEQKKLAHTLVDRFLQTVDKEPHRRRASTAELLDLVEVCMKWNLNENSPELKQLLEITVRKSPEEAL